MNTILLQLIPVSLWSILADVAFPDPVERFSVGFFLPAILVLIVIIITVILIKKNK